MDFLTLLYGIFTICGAITVIAAIVCVILKKRRHICLHCKNYAMADSMHECYLSLYEFMKTIELDPFERLVQKIRNNMSGRDKEGNLIKFDVSDEVSPTVYSYNLNNRILTLYRNRFIQDMAVYGAKEVKKQLNDSGFVVILNYGVQNNRYGQCKYFRYK